MSYLIAMYVYYHGNNLAVFGITPGLQEEGPRNQGILRPEEINPELVDQTLIQGVMEQEKKEEEARKVNDWNEIMRAAIQKSHQDSYKMYQSGAVQNTIFESTPDAIIEDYEDDGVIPMDFFSSINNM